MRKEMREELNRLFEKYHVTKLALLKNPLTKKEDIYKLNRMVNEAEMRIFDKYADDLQKLNAGQKIRIVK